MVSSVNDKITTKNFSSDWLKLVNNLQEEPTLIPIFRKNVLSLPVEIVVLLDDIT